MSRACAMFELTITKVYDSEKPQDLQAVAMQSLKRRDACLYQGLLRPFMEGIDGRINEIRLGLIHD
jgi:hypothetical protein